MYFCPIRNQFLNPPSQPTTSNAHGQFPPVRQRSSVGSGSIGVSRNVVAIPQRHSNDDALTKIEALFETIVDAVSAGSSIVIPYRRSTNAQAFNLTASASNPRDGRHMDSVRFPGRNPQELRRFGQSLHQVDVGQVPSH